MVSDSMVVVASVVVSADVVVVAAAVVVLSVVVVVVVSCLSLSRTSITDSVLLEIFWLSPDNVSFGGSSWR